MADALLDGLHGGLGLYLLGPYLVCWTVSRCTSLKFVSEFLAPSFGLEIFESG